MHISRTIQNVKAIFGTNISAHAFLRVLLCGYCVVGCAAYDPQPLFEASLFDRAETQSEGGLRVSVTVLDEEQTQALFGTALAPVGIQPVWLSIKNDDTVPYILFPHNMDHNAFSPLEAAYRCHSWFSSATNQAMDAHFVKRTIKKIIPPGAATSGFVYTNLDLGAKEVVVTLLGRGTFKDFFFFLSSGNLHTHYAEVDFASLHRPDDLVVCASEPELRAALEQLPCCTTNEDESALGDPLNLVLIGEAEELLAAFVDRHWDMTEKLHAGSVWREFTAFLTGARYRYAPFSPLYFSGRRQDLALQKARETIRARNHLRLWRTPIRFTGKPVWVGQVSRDIGVRVTTKTWNLLTHRIDPNVDDTRDYVVQSLILSQRVATVGYIRGGEATQEDAPRRNLTGDPYITDGLRAVLIFAKGVMPTFQLHTLNWEWPEALTANGVVPRRGVNEH